ncbi:MULTISPECIES: hypothetical protein [Vagococcus]|uniref:Uncharacterized protein n=1 Tax=Vagococcus fluvialis bH819 TaxID=1255619 RepID=A0A1X6WMC1_9ENTE|nr:MULTISPECIES: hypothetical protein [Vagococcus]SLM85483.1 hypothetical protein FM121_05245 [Vagococcus fluvialis bH819]HCM89222.1 hypothetical protein [Vagococcus sp.]
MANLVGSLFGTLLIFLGLSIQTKFTRLSSNRTIRPAIWAYISILLVILGIVLFFYFFEIYVALKKG